MTVNAFLSLLLEHACPDLTSVVVPRLGTAFNRGLTLSSGSAVMPAGRLLSKGLGAIDTGGVGFSRGSVTVTVTVTVNKPPGIDG